MTKNNNGLSLKKCFKLAAVATCCYISYKSPLGLSASIAFVGLIAASKVPTTFGFSFIAFPALLATIAYTIVGSSAPLFYGPKYPERRISYSDARSKALVSLSNEITTNRNIDFPYTNTFSFSKGLAHTLSWSTNYDNYVNTHSLVARPYYGEIPGAAELSVQDSSGKALGANRYYFEIVEQNVVGRPISTNKAIFMILAR